MDIMNLINEICLLYVQLINTKKHQIFKRFKYKKEIKSMENKIRKKNIFKLSDVFVTFVLSLPVDIKKICGDNGVRVHPSYIIINIDNKYIDYSPANMKFVVTDNDENLIYTVYKNTKISKNTQNRWNHIADAIYDKYIDIVNIVANQLALAKRKSD